MACLVLNLLYSYLPTLNSVVINSTDPRVAGVKDIRLSSESVYKDLVAKRNLMVLTIILLKDLPSYSDWLASGSVSS